MASRALKVSKASLKDQPEPLRRRSACRPNSGKLAATTAPTSTITQAM